MLNVRLIYRPPSYWRILVCSGRCPRQFICLKKFRSLVNPIEVCCKEIIFQGILATTGFLPNGKLCLIIKGGVTREPVHVSRPRNISYVNKFKRSI